MRKITLNLYGRCYEFSYSKDFRYLKKREDGGKEFYLFTRFAHWSPDGKHILTKADVMKIIKATAPLNLPRTTHKDCDCMNCRPWTT